MCIRDRVISAGSIVTDNRIDRTHPLQFSATKDTSIFGLGLVWTDTNTTSQLVMMSGPTRLWSSENIDINSDKQYCINGKPVIAETSLGSGITHSNLTTVGELETLVVQGSALFNSSIAVNIDVAIGTYRYTGNGIDTTSNASITVNNTEIVYGDTNQINIGDKTQQQKPVKIFGPLSVNINNPDPTLQFSVNGDVALGGRRFTNSTQMPTIGTFVKGDICWNTDPQPNNYVGWICIVSGTPGVWYGFGMIASQ